MFVLGCCCCSVAQLCLTLCDSVDCRTPAFSVLHYLPEEFDQTHVHWASDAIQPTHPLSSPFPPAFSLSLHQGLFQWVGSLHQVAKVLEVQLQHQSFHEYSWLISFRIDWFALLPVQESSPTPQFKHTNSSALSLLRGPTLTSMHNYWKNQSLDYKDLCQQSDVSAFLYAIYVCAGMTSCNSKTDFPVSLWRPVSFL